MQYRLILPALFIIGLFLTACENSPSGGQQTAAADTTYYNDNYIDSLAVTEPVVATAKHYFSDSAAMDSFVAFLPAGNAAGGFCYLKIFNPKHDLIYSDSISLATFYNPATKGKEDDALKDIKRSMAALFDENNFSLSGGTDAIKNAGADQIKNMVTWNELINDSTRIIFSYDDLQDMSYVGYSQKLRRAATAVEQVAEQDEGE